LIREEWRLWRLLRCCAAATVGPVVIRVLLGLAGLLTFCGLGLSVLSYALMRRWVLTTHAYRGVWADLLPAMIVPWVIIGAMVLYVTT
jgi:hypothetical protein